MPGAESDDLTGAVNTGRVRAITLARQPGELDHRPFRAIRSNRTPQECAGSIALAAGTLLIVVAAATGSGAAFLTGSIIAGAGFGAAFLGGLRALVTVIPPEHRASVMSAFYVAAYASLSTSADLEPALAELLAR